MDKSMVDSLYDYEAHEADWGDTKEKSDTDEEPIAVVRRKFRHPAESIRAGARLLKTECGKEGKIFKWKPDGESAWSKPEEVYRKKALRYFKRHPGLYEVVEYDD